MRKKKVIKVIDGFDEDVLCICGHPNIDHFINDKNKQEWCGDWIDFNPCYCRNFTVDNLLYLEKRYDLRNSNS